MESFYRINVAQHGVFYFAIDHKAYSSKSVEVTVRDIRSRFPESEGFNVSIAYWECTGQTIIVE